VNIETDGYSPTVEIGRACVAVIGSHSIKLDFAVVAVVVAVPAFSYNLTSASRGCCFLGCITRPVLVQQNLRGSFFKTHCCLIIMDPPISISFSLLRRFELCSNKYNLVWC